MRTTFSRASLVAILGGLALWGCEAQSPRGGAVSETGEPAPGAPGSSLAELLRDADPYARARALGALLPKLGAEAVPEVEAALGDEALRVGAAEHELLVRFWASHRPEEATRWAADRSPTFHRDAAVLAALPSWVAADLQSALVAVEKWRRLRPDVREPALRALVIGWYGAGHPGLAQYIHDMGVGLEQQIALSTYLRAVMTEEGVQAVMDWAESLPEDDAAYKLTVYRQVASALPLFDQASAMRWCEAHCDGPFGNNLRSLIAGRWAERDGPSALAWLGTAPEGHERDVAIRTNFAVWAGWHPEEALDWLAEQARDGELPAWLVSVIPVYAVLLAERSPAEAIAWAQKIEQELSREVTLIKIARRWRELDQAAADAWLEASPLSAEARGQARDPSWRRRGGRPGAAGGKRGE